MAQANAADSARLSSSHIPSVNYNKRRKSSSLNSVVTRKLSSQENHINRIRSRRLSYILPDADNINLEPDFNSRRKSHQNCVRKASLKEYNSKEENKNLEDINSISEKRRKSAIYLESFTTRKQSNVSNPNIKSKGNKNLKLNNLKVYDENAANNPGSFENPGNPEKTANPRNSSNRGNPGNPNIRNATRNASEKNPAKTANPRNSSNRGNPVNPNIRNSKRNASEKNPAKNLKDKSNDTEKSLRQSQRVPNLVKSERLKDEGKEGEFPTQYSEEDFEKESLNTVNKEEIFTSETSRSIKDAVVLSWLHGLKCPFSQEENYNSDSSKYKRSVVQIYKKPSKSSIKLPENIKSSGARNTSKSPSTKREKSEISDEGDISINKEYVKLQEVERLSPEETYEKGKHVEMQVSELNKMQITINPELFSNEDAALVIWVDAIPKTYFTPKYSRRLSIFPQSDVALDKTLTDVTESPSQSQFERMLTQKAEDVFYPPITILKNIALDYEFDLKTLDEDNDNSVYVTECKLDHAQSKLNKDLKYSDLLSNEEFEE